MPERDAAGMSRLDADRAHSMEHEGGASAATVEAYDSQVRPRTSLVTAAACLAGIAAGATLVKLWRAR